MGKTCAVAALVAILLCVTCAAGGVIEVIPPEMSETSFLVDCDFDSAIRFCHYTNSETDEADWYTTSGKLNDDEIGPVADHTTGNYTGIYLYTKTSYSKSLESRLEGVTAVAPADGGCVRFWYHMYGYEIGSLKVHTEKSGDLGPARWSQSGYTKESKWYEASISIEPGSEFKLVFVSESGTGFRGNIAIDDISFVDGQCPVKPPEMPDPSFLVDCDFDSAIPFCHYTNSETDEADWYTTSGKLNDDEIGPVADHTTGNYAGTYLFTKTSYSKSYESRLEGVTVVAPADGGCVGFWYHMYGYEIGSLKVHTEKSGDLGPARWSQSGYTKESKWYEASISIEPGSEFKLVFVSKSGTGFRGNIAIDDISYVNGPCGERPDPFFLVDCDFDSAIPFCHYTNSETDDADWYTTSGKLNDDEIGPVADHTTGNYAGTYLYTKTSYSKSLESRLEGVTAVTPAEGGCVRFWYHMYGYEIGSLKVHTEKSGDLGPARWSQSGYTKVSQWYEASISIEPASEFKLVFVSESGTSFRGNIAIDDISLAGGPCPVIPPEMPDPSFLVDCDFEGAIPFCHYTNSKTDDADWYTTSGRLNGEEIGPVADHTTGNYTGTYLYTKTSYSESLESRLEGVTAVAPADGGCVRFWYHMYGSSIGSLKVHTEASGDLGPARWSQSGYTKESKWYEASISIDPGEDFKLVFVSQSGVGSVGNIAIDDIGLVSGKC